ncbi:MAG: sulfatase-like hydrolase/transferase [Halapricum sp.]
MNVFFVCVDCLRRDFVDGPWADTPFLDSLRTEGLFYEQLFSSATTTTPAVASFMSGCYAERNGIYSLRNATLSPDVETLAEAFSRAGYDTHALATGPLAPETGLDRGFDTYEDRDADRDCFTDWFEDAIDRIDGFESPFFGYLHLWEIHARIETLPEFDIPEYGPNAYARTLSALDRKLETVSEHLPDDTLFVLHGDHGESISARHDPLAWSLRQIRDRLRLDWGLDTRAVERRIDGFASGRRHDYPDHYLAGDHGDTVYDFTSNVPLLLSGPGVPAATVSEQVRQIDLWPTLLDLADIEYDPETIHGRSLVPVTEVESRPAYIRGCGESLHGEDNWMAAVRLDGQKYVSYPSREWPDELYDLDADRWELTPRVPDDPDRFRRHIPERERESEAIDIDDRLRDLGYLE